MRNRRKTYHYGGFPLFYRRQDPRCQCEGHTARIQRQGLYWQEWRPLNFKTIYSYSTALQTDFGVEAEYSEKHKGYVLRNPPFEAYELRLIVDSVQASKFITQTEAKRLTEKKTQHFGNGRRQNLSRRAYIYGRIRSQNDSVVKETDRIREAIAADCKNWFPLFPSTP